jgi:hypothetical protein
VNVLNVAQPLARAVLNEKRVDHRCVLTETPVREKQPGFWEQLLVDPSFDGLTDLEKLVAGCEIIVALDDLDLLAAR